MPGALTMMARSVSNFASSRLDCVTICVCSSVLYGYIDLAPAFAGFSPRSNSATVDIIRRGPPRLVKTHTIWNQQRCSPQAFGLRLRAQRQ